jgi:hypothetical protein
LREVGTPDSALTPAPVSTNQRALELSNLMAVCNSFPSAWAYFGVALAVIESPAFFIR